MEGEQIRALVEDAHILITNDYERALLENKTGWSSDEVLERVGTRITTLGPKGCVIDQPGGPSIEIPAAPERRRVDPTGVGDGFRAGLLAGLSWALGWERSAQIGSLMATYVLEHVGTQEYDVEPAGFVERFTNVYGNEAADEIRTFVG
jgi:adenosine kinase